MVDQAHAEVAHQAHRLGLGGEEAMQAVRCDLHQQHFFLAGAGTAPARVKWHLIGSFAAQVVVGVATASARPFTTLAFGILVPVHALAHTGLWAARYGRFGPRRTPNGPRIEQNAGHG